MPYRLFDKTTRTNRFTEAVNLYLIDIDRGNYRTLSEYTQSTYQWTDQNVIDSLVETLSACSSFLSILNLTHADLRSQLEDASPISFPEAINLLTSLALVKNAGSRSQLLEQLGTQEVLVQIEARIPGACFASIHSLRNDDMTNEEKFDSLNSIILGAIDTIDMFGVLGKWAFKIAIDDWLSIYDKLDKSRQELFSSEKEEYTKLSKIYFPAGERPERLGFLEKCTLSTWDALECNISTPCVPRVF